MRLVQPPAQPVTVTTFGDAVNCGRLEDALRLQWAYGFPRTPKGFGQLTHGFYRYPAGLQPAAAAQLLELLPPGRVLDPFCGGGTTLVEAERSGRAAVGTDASPLAVFTAQHHTWRASAAELDALRQLAAAATTASTDGGGGGGASRLKRWQPLHDALTSSAAAGDERLSRRCGFASRRRCSAPRRRARRSPPSCSSRRSARTPTPSPRSARRCRRRCQARRCRFPTLGRSRSRRRSIRW